MFDALLYCSIMVATMRDAGTFAAAAGLLEAAKAKWDALRAAALRRPGSPPSAPCGAADIWTQSLARLETYVAAMV